MIGLYVSVAILIVTNMILWQILARHSSVLKWFALHIKLDPRNIPDEIPEDLRSIMGEEADKDTITKS
jgi:hypothetical protein